MSPLEPVVRPTLEDPVAASASEVVGGPSGRRSLGHPWWTPVRVVLAVACVAWLMAMLQKAPCAADGWSGSSFRYTHMCYSDVPYLYVGRGFAERKVPYADTAGRYHDLEYPVLIGYFAYGTSVVTQLVHGWPDLDAREHVAVDALYGARGVHDESQDFFVLTALLLAPFVLLSAYFLATTDPKRPWDAMAFAASPVLVLAGLVNWDMLAVATMAGALWAWARDRPVLAGALVGLGTATKLYPLFLLGAFLVVAVRRRTVPTFLAAAGAAAGAWLLVNLPAMLYGFHGWTAFWVLNSSRGPDLGSLWLVAAHAGHPASPHAINVVSWLFFVAVCVGVLVLGLQAPVEPRVAQLALLVLLGFLLVNKVYSPQYVLWLLPLAVLARPSWRDLLIWQAGEVFYFAMVWMYLGGVTASATAGGEDIAYSAAVVVRVLAELYLAAVIVRDLVQPRVEPPLVRSRRAA